MHYLKYDMAASGGLLHASIGLFTMAYQIPAINNHDYIIENNTIMIMYIIYRKST